MPPRDHDLLYLLGGAFHRLAFTAWGDPHAHPVLCVHGLSRNAHDFDVLAAALADDFYVICPDLPGRGRSAWLRRPPPCTRHLNYVGALAHLLAFIDRPVHWVGTSLGGICGMLAAAAPGNPVRRMVLNDIGPFVPKEAYARIRSYVGTMPEFATLDEAERYFPPPCMPVLASSPTRNGGTWRKLRCAPFPMAAWPCINDPAMTIPLREGPVQDTDMWHFWDR